MAKYRVTSYKINPVVSEEQEDFTWAKELREDFDLFHLSVKDVFLVWSRYSEDCYSASWLHPTKENVEKAFRVTLEEVEDGSNS